jgi:succinylglutamic semialdehyde dehydrogenase
MGGDLFDAAQNMLAAQHKLEGLGGKVLLRMRQPDPRSTVLTPGSSTSPVLRCRMKSTLARC